MPVVKVPMMVEASVATMKAFCALRQLSVQLSRGPLNRGAHLEALLLNHVGVVHFGGGGWCEWLHCIPFRFDGLGSIRYL
jgi:hypothetical protein